LTHSRRFPFVSAGRTDCASPRSFWPDSLPRRTATRDENSSTHADHQALVAALHPIDLAPVLVLHGCGPVHPALYASRPSAR